MFIEKNFDLITSHLRFCLIHRELSLIQVHIPSVSHGFFNLSKRCWSNLRLKFDVKLMKNIVIIYVYVNRDSTYLIIAKIQTTNNY